MFVCAEFFSAVFDPISIKLGHMLYVWVYLCPLEYRGCATPGGWVTLKKLVFLGVLGVISANSGSFRAHCVKVYGLIS